MPTGAVLTRGASVCVSLVVLLFDLRLKIKKPAAKPAKKSNMNITLRLGNPRVN